METRKAAQTKILITVIAVLIAVVIAVSLAVVLLEKKDTGEEESTDGFSVSQHQGNIQLNDGGFDLTRNNIFFADNETSSVSQQASTSIAQQEASTKAGETSTRKQTTTKKNTQTQNKKLSADKFSELGISGFEMRKIKYLTTHYGFWYTGKLKDNNETINTIGYYIERFADEYGFDRSNNWEAAPQVFNDYISGMNLKVIATLSIDEFNKVLRDIYGDSAEQLSYSDFPELLELDTTTRIWHTLGGNMGLYDCGECLVFVDYDSDFESNDQWPDFTGFRIEGNLISALWLEYCEFSDYDEPMMLVIQESMLAKGSNGYYLHSVNPDIYGGGSSNAETVKSLSDYEIYDDVSGENKLVDLGKYYPELATEAKAGKTEKAESFDSVEQAYIAYLANRKNNGIESDFVETEDEGYCIFDLNGDGVDEMIIIGLIPSSGGWHYCRLYSCDPKTYTVKPASDLIYYYSVVRYSPKYSSLITCPYKGNMYYMSFLYIKYDGNYCKDYFELYSENYEDGSSKSSIYYYDTKETIDNPSSEEYSDDMIDFVTKPVSDIKAK